jgi:thiamine-phosphate pyrophosphorylase
MNSAVPFSGLHVLADDDPRWPQGPVDQAEAACAGGASVIQLRIKHATDSQALEWAQAIRSMTRHAGVLFVLNDRFDLALAAGADGLHLGQDDMPADRIPKEALAKLAIGLSTHNLDQASAAAKAGPNYVAFGPIFGTQSKASPETAPGLEALEQAVHQVAPLPLVAIGGINGGNIRAILDTGASGAAVISAVAAAANPISATRELAKLFEKNQSLDREEK